MKTQHHHITVSVIILFTVLLSGCSSGKRYAFRQTIKVVKQATASEKQVEEIHEVEAQVTEASNEATGETAHNQIPVSVNASAPFMPCMPVTQEETTAAAEVVPAFVERTIARGKEAVKPQELQEEPKPSGHHSSALANTALVFALVSCLSAIGLGIAAKVERSSGEPILTGIIITNTVLAGIAGAVLGGMDMKRKRSSRGRKGFVISLVILGLCTVAGICAGIYSLLMSIKGFGGMGNVM